MQKISAIVEQLTVSDSALATPLFETKVLATRIKNDELLKWVNQEIEGYDEDALLPDFRIVEGILKGSYMNGRLKVTNTALPVPQGSADVEDLLTKLKLRQSCSALEYLVRPGETQSAISYSLSGNLIQTLQQMYAEQNPYLSLYSVHIEASVSAVHDVLSVIRSKLLELMLELEVKFGETASIADLRSSNTMINNYVQNIIYNSGSNNVINTGNDSALSS
jgi:hypothetical protein